MNIGYACLTVGVFATKQRTCTLKNATSDVLIGLIKSNLESLNNILDYNMKNGIMLFRISSEIIPFGSHPKNALNWWEIFNDKLNEIGRKAITNGIRLSMHASHYTILNSPDEEVLKRSVEDLRYHARLMDAMGLGQENKIVLHVGGVYGDKREAIKRFINNYHCLDENIRKRLVIENDDRCYDISDVLNIGEREGIPVVFDNLHHQVNTNNTRSEAGWISACKKTWKKEDGNQKLHYSQQDIGKRPGSHSPTINGEDFFNFYKQLPKYDIDIMVEVKDKNLSAVKCINVISSPEIKRLENEWARYKYLVLEHCPQAYYAVRQLLKDKSLYPVIDFYKLIDDSLSTPIKPQNAVNAAQHVWGYFKDFADLKAYQTFEKSINKISLGESTNSMKKFLWRLTLEAQQKYLENSLYFLNVFN